MFILFLIEILNSQLTLNGIPLQFQFRGQAKYTPDSGGQELDGKYSWIGIKFSKQSTTDILIVQLSPRYRTQTALLKGHKTTVSDYFQTSTNFLSLDSQTNYDITGTTYVTPNQINIQFIRTLKQVNGQDFSAYIKKYSMQTICFFTGQNGFDRTSWQGDYQQCYSFQLTGLVSKFRGKHVKNINLNGIETQIHGYIYGHFDPKLYLSVYHPAAKITYSSVPAIALQLGENLHKTQDFVVWSPTLSQVGDYYGNAVTAIFKDVFSDGYDDSIINVVTQNIDQTVTDTSYANYKVQFERYLNSYDDFDKVLSSVMSICITLHRTNINGVQLGKSCEQLSIPSLNLSFFILSSMYLLQLL